MCSIEDLINRILLNKNLKVKMCGSRERFISKINKIKDLQEEYGIRGIASKNIEFMTV